MKKYDIFDIMGPIMIGPSSSHTAGAARIERMAKIIYGKEITEVTFFCMEVLRRLIKAMEATEH